MVTPDNADFLRVGFEEVFSDLKTTCTINHVTTISYDATWNDESETVSSTPTDCLIESIDNSAFNVPVGWINRGSNIAYLTSATTVSVKDSITHSGKTYEVAELNSEGVLGEVIYQMVLLSERL